MKFRRTAAAAAAVLAVGGVAGCRTNVGTAAWVDGQRITESDVNSYLTVNAQALTANGSSHEIAPRAVVLQELIQQRLYLRLLQALVGKSAPTLAKVDASVSRDLGQGAVESITRQVKAKGYSDKLVPVVLRVIDMQNQLGRIEQAGIDVAKTLRQIDFPVSVNPRFGRWDATTKSFDDTLVVPGYLTPK